MMLTRADRNSTSDMVPVVSKSRLRDLSGSTLSVTSCRAVTENMQGE